MNPSTALIHLCNMQTHDDNQEGADVIHRLSVASSYDIIATQLHSYLYDVDSLKDYIPRHLHVTYDEDLNALGDKNDE